MANRLKEKYLNEVVPADRTIQLLTVMAVPTSRSFEHGW